MTLVKSEILEELRRLYPGATQEYLEERCDEEAERAQRGVGSTRLKDVKDFWLIMAINLPKPVFERRFPWLYDVDWHFDQFEADLQKYGKSIPRQIFIYIRRASVEARKLHNDGQKDAANALMAKVFNLSWTKKSSLNQWVEQFDE